MFGSSDEREERNGGPFGEVGNVDGKQIGPLFVELPVEAVFGFELSFGGCDQRHELLKGVAPENGHHTCTTGKSEELEARTQTNRNERASGGVPSNSKTKGMIGTTNVKNSRAIPRRENGFSASVPARISRGNKNKALAITPHVRFTETGNSRK
jgi:hypothetical protein